MGIVGLVAGLGTYYLLLQIPKLRGEADTWSQLVLYLVPGLAGLIGALVALYFWHRHRLWREASKLDEEQRAAIDDLREQLDDIRNGDIDNLYIEDAISILVEKSSDHLNKARQEIRDEIFHLALRGKLKIWGRVPIFGGMTSPSDNRLEIPGKFFLSTYGGSFENEGYVLKLFNSSGQDHQHSEYWDLHLNRRQVMAYFNVKCD